MRMIHTFFSHAARPLAFWRLVHVLLVASAAVSVSACSKVYIPNTDIEDSSVNRQVIEFCEQYRHALEEMNVAKLVKLMSPAYFEDGGNTKSDDDADYEKIRDFLTGEFRNTAGIRYEIRYRRVTFFAESSRIHVDYTYAAAWKLPDAAGKDEWHHKVADNRLELVHDGDSFKISAGM